MGRLCPHIETCKKEVDAKHYSEFCLLFWERCKYLKNIKRRPIDWLKLDREVNKKREK